MGHDVDADYYSASLPKPRQIFPAPPPFLFRNSFQTGNFPISLFLIRFGTERARSEILSASGRHPVPSPAAESGPDERNDHAFYVSLGESYICY